MVDLVFILCIIVIILITLLVILMCQIYSSNIKIKSSKLKEVELTNKINENEIKIATANSQKELEMLELQKRTRKDTAGRSRSTLKGQIVEQLAPLLEDFNKKYELSDARFIGKPVDYIIFQNLTKLNDEIINKIPDENRSELCVVFAEIKTGGSNLTIAEKKIRDAIEAKRVKWDQITIDIPESELVELPLKQNTSKSKTTIVDLNNVHNENNPFNNL